MTLGNLLYEINTAYKESCDKLEGYTHISEVNSFLQRRKQDIEDFKRMVSGYNVTANILSVQSDLRQKGVLPKFYGGICLKGGEYFKVTKSIEKLIKREELSDEEFEDILKQYYLDKADDKEEKQLSFDKDFAIFDELTSEEEAELLYE